MEYVKDPCHPREQRAAAVLERARVIYASPHQAANIVQLSLESDRTMEYETDFVGEYAVRLAQYLEQQARLLRHLAEC